MQLIREQISPRLVAGSAECRRLFHGRGHCFEGLEHLVIDWFPPVAVVRLYEEVDAQWLSALETMLHEFTEIEALVVQERGRGRETINRLAWGELPEQLVTEEAGLKYRIQPLQNQNSGLFLDMAPGRRWVQDNAQGKQVLNLFAYTCAFSVAALAGDAAGVVNLDMSRSALSAGRENHRLNEHPLERVKFLAHDLLKSWGKVRKLGPYDLIVIDPPSFQPGSFVAQKDYQKVLRRLPELMNAGGKVLVCHNDPACDTSFVRDLMEQECPQFRFEERLKLSEDFPDSDEERGLKALVFSV